MIMPKTISILVCTLSLSKIKQNKQNCKIILTERNGDLIGSYSFEIENDATIMINGDAYCTMIIAFLYPFFCLISRIDLTPLAYFMWNIVKENCYTDK